MKAATHTNNESANVATTAVISRETKSSANHAPKKRRVTKLRALGTFFKRGACSTTLMTVLDRAAGYPMDLEEKATEPLAGGMMMGYQCGMIWGSAFAAGAEAHRMHGPGTLAETAAMAASERVVESFRDCHGCTDCIDITDTDPSNTWETTKYHLFKGGVVRCARKISRYAPTAQQSVDEALAEQPQGHAESCASRLARMMGASDQHATMAAGLAGGIGLSGGACGALGTAIWLVGIRGRQAGLKNKTINAQVEALKERFQEVAEYEYECSEIVGRKFGSIEDHTEHVRTGGCAQLLEALARAARELTNPEPKPESAAADQANTEQAAG